MEVLEIVEATTAWKRQGNKTTRKYRCTSGPRKGQVRASPASCNAPINVKKRNTLKKTKQKMGGHVAYRSQQTKKRNPASRRLKTLNKPRRRNIR